MPAGRKYLLPGSSVWKAGGGEEQVWGWNAGRADLINNSDSM